MATTVYTIHKPDADRLAEVVAEMRELGAPTVEVVDCGGYYMALEGSHRVAAAAELGLEPKWIVHEQDDEIEISKYDWFDAANWAETTYAAGEVAGELFAPDQAGDYRFD